MYVDNRKRKRESEDRNFSYPVYSMESIPDNVKSDIENRHKTITEFTSEIKNPKNEEDLHYDINNFEIYYEELKKGNMKEKSCIYDYLRNIESKDRDYYVQGVITKPQKSRYFNKLIVASISEYSLQYGDKSQWSLWVKIADKEWFKLCDPYIHYAKYFSPTLYRFKVVMFTTLFLEKEKKNPNYSKLETYLEKNIKEYDNDIIYFKDEVFKHAREFLSLPPNDDSFSAIDKEMINKLENQNQPISKELKFKECKPDPPAYSIEKIQDNVNKEAKKMADEMMLYFNRRVGNTVKYKDVEKEKLYQLDDGLKSIKQLISNLGKNEKTFKDYYLSNKQIEDVKAGYPYNYDFDINSDENTLEHFINSNSNGIDKLIGKDRTIVQKELYLNKRDILEFSKLPKETITYKRYESLFLDSGSIKQHNFNLQDDPNQDLLPFLICRICGIGKHIECANTNPRQKIDNEMFQSIQDYISHLEKHRLEILKSKFKKERDAIDKQMEFNSYLYRSRTETIEANALLQLQNEVNNSKTNTTNSQNKQSSTFYWP